MDRTASTLQAVNLNGSGRRTMSLEEEDDDDEHVDAVNPWDQIRATSGPMSAVSESKSDGSPDPQPVAEVTILRISNLIKGCTTAQLYKAFDMTKEDMRIEVQSADEALLHFHQADRAMKAYFAYLSSTNSIGNVSPYEPGLESLSSSPIKHPGSVLRNRRSFQGSHNGSTTMLSALSSISAWRSSDKLHTLNSNHQDREFKLGHRTNSSRSSIHSKSTERIPSLQKHTSPAMAMTSIGPPLQSEDRPLMMKTTTTATPSRPMASSLRTSSTSTVEQSEEHKSTSKPASIARKFFSGSLGLRSKSKVKGEENGLKEAAKVDTTRRKQQKKEEERLAKSAR